MKSRRVVAGLLVLAGIVALTGAVFAAPAVERSEPLLISRWAGPHADDLKDVVAGYPDGEVIVDDIAYGSLRQKQLTSFQVAPGAGSYDAVWVANQWMKEYVDAGYLMPLDDLIADAGFDTSIYAAGMMDGVQFGGNTYGLPTFAQTLLLTYDTEAFKAAGVKVPTTSDELVEAARYFKENEGTGIAIPARQGDGAVTLYAQILFSSGGDYFDEDGNLALTSEESIYAATIYDQLAKYSVEGALAWHHGEVAEAVRTKAAPIGTVMSGLAYMDANPEVSMIVDSVGYAELAGPDGFAAGKNNYWVWCIPANTADADASFRLIRWLTSPGTEKEMTLRNQQISAITSLANDSEVLAAAPFLPVVMRELANGKADPSLVNFQTLREALVVGLSELATTNADPAAVMARVQAELKDVDFSY